MSYVMGGLSVTGIVPVSVEDGRFAGASRHVLGAGV